MATKYREWYSDKDITGGVKLFPNFDKLLFEVLPRLYRPYSEDGIDVKRKGLYKYIQVVIEHIKGLHNVFMNYHYDWYKYENVNGQQLVMQTYLRDKYTSNEIVVISNQQVAEFSHLFNIANLNGYSSNEEYLFNKSEDETVNGWYNRMEFDNGFDFTVWIPEILASKVDQITTDVTDLHMLGCTFRIQILN